MQQFLLAEHKSLTCSGEAGRLLTTQVLPTSSREVG